MIIEEENKFIFNLTRLCGPTNTVTFEIMLDIITFINNNSVTEGQFIESAYLDSIFHYDEIIDKDCFYIFSLQDLIKKYEKAKSNNEYDFFIILRKKHKKAREFLEDNDIKQKIKNLIEIRKNKIEKDMKWNVINSLLELVKNYPDSNIVKIISPILPEMMIKFEI